MLFVCNFQMTLEASGTLASGANIQYLCTLVRGEVLRQLDTFSVEVGSIATTYLNRIVSGLVLYFFPTNVVSNQNHVMHCRMKKPRKFKVG